MYYKPKRQAGILKVDDFFATLKNVDSNGDFEFIFDYVISQSKALKANSLTVEIRVHSEMIKQEKVIASNTQLRSNVDVQSLLRRSLT
jgi:hypothetical protein